MNEDGRLFTERAITSGPEGETCGTCGHFIRKEFNGRTYFKCAMIGDSNCDASDIRKGQPACRDWRTP